MMRPSGITFGFLHAAVVALAIAVAPAAFGQVKVDNPWVRGAVPGQLTTGAFFEVTASREAQLVKVDSPVAGIVEVHVTEKKGDLMTMRAVPAVSLPANQPVRFAPGGYHVMLMDLKQPVKNGQTVPLTLTIEYAGKKRETVEVKAPVRAVAATPQHQH